MGKQRWVCGLLVTVLLAAAPTGGRAEMTTEQRLRALEGALKEAQEEIQRLRKEVREQKATSARMKNQVEEQGKTQAEQAKKTVALPDWAKRVSIFGDVRVRHEGFYNQPARDGQQVTARNRERLRARLGLKASFSDELSATIRMATGSPNDPISTNETFDDAFTPENVNLDWAYITVTPGQTFGIRPGLLAVSGGKFPNPIFRPGEMVFDDDLSLEGATQTLALLGKPQGVLEQFRIHAIQATFDEVSNAEDGWLFGGQLNPSFKVDPVTLDFGAGQFWYLNEDLIARELNSNSTLRNTHEVVTVIEDDEEVIDAFVSSFNLTNLAARATLPNAVAGMPLSVFADYVHNWGADHADNGYFAGFKLGQAKARGDWTAGAFYEYLEREAALSVFSGSDFGLGGTNQQGPVVTLEYQLMDPLTLSARNYFTNFIRRPDDMNNPTLFRLQLDALLKF